jgi:hypothetical protein
MFKFFNGTKKVTECDKNLMDYEAVKICIKSLKFKNSEGFDMHKLMTLAYSEREYLKNSFSKTIPAYKKKSQTKNRKNYRPIANLCSLSKVFKK